jgi:hypothetical protein
VGNAGDISNHPVICSNERSACETTLCGYEYIVPIHQKLETNQLLNPNKSVAPVLSLLTGENAAMQNFPVLCIEVVPIPNQLKAGTARVTSVQEKEEVSGRSAKRFLV